MMSNLLYTESSHSLCYHICDPFSGLTSKAIVTSHSKIAQFTSRMELLGYYSSIP
uniref:Uncharacterized protein n=1 Tax=Arion vulgaris TaxID=1028688 RepID=A0A0B7AXA9_9EUPU